MKSVCTCGYIAKTFKDQIDHIQIINDCDVPDKHEFNTTVKIDEVS